jgi:general secretion pathway protein G
MRQRGFTLIELLVALAILAAILSIAVPRYFNNIETAQENVLKEDLYVMRDAIDHFYADKGTYPNLLSDLVTQNYLRSLPVDPFTQSANSWIVVAPTQGSIGAVYDVHSGAPNKAQDGTWLKDW